MKRNEMGIQPGKFYKFWSSETKDGRFSMSYYESGNERGKSACVRRGKSKDALIRHPTSTLPGVLIFMLS